MQEPLWDINFYIFNGYDTSVGTLHQRAVSGFSVRSSEDHVTTSGRLPIGNDELQSLDFFLFNSFS